MTDDFLLRKLAYFQARVGAIEKKKKIFSELGDMQAFDGLKADVHNYIASCSSSELIPTDPLEEVSGRLDDLCSFFSDVKRLHVELLHIGAEALVDGVPSISKNDLHELLGDIPIQRQALQSKVVAFQPRLRSLDWAGNICESDIHSELTECADILGKKIPSESKTRRDFCSFVYGMGSIWESVKDHFSRVEKRTYELLEVHEQHRVGLENALAQCRFGNHITAIENLQSIGIDVENCGAENKQFSDLRYQEVLSAVLQMHNISKEMDEMCRTGIRTKISVLSSDYKNVATSILFNKANKAYLSGKDTLREIGKKLDGYREYIGSYPGSELQRDYHDLLLQGTDLFKSAQSEFEIINQQCSKSGKRKRWLVIGSVSLVLIVFLLSQAHGFFKERTQVRLAFSFSDPSMGSEMVMIKFNGKEQAWHEGQWHTIPSGEINLEVIDVRFRHRSKKFQVKYGRKVDLGTLELVPVHGSLEVITDPPGADVYEWRGMPPRGNQKGKQKKGETPWIDTNHMVGPITVQVAHGKYGTQTLEGVVFDGKKLSLAHRFPRADIKISTDPIGVDIYTDKGPQVDPTTGLSKKPEAIGKTPMTIKDLKVGPYAYHLDAGLLGRKDIRVDIEDRQNLDLSYQFPWAKVHVFSDLQGAEVMLSDGKTRKLPWKGKLPPGLNFFHAFKFGFIKPKVCVAYLTKNTTNEVRIPFYKPGTLQCWENGRVIASVPNIISVAKYDSNEIALTSQGDVFQVNAHMLKERRPPLLKLGGARMIAASYDYCVALKFDRTLFFWKGKKVGGLATPAHFVSANGLRMNIIAVAAGGTHFLSLTNSGDVGVWRSSDPLSPKPAKPPPAVQGRVVAIDAGGSHNVVLLRDGTVAAWGGNNEAGQCNVPKGLKNVVSVAAGAQHSLALRMNGTVVAWGRKKENLPALKNVWAIAANPSSNISFAILRDGRIATWGTHTSSKARIPSSLRNVIKIEPGKQRHWSISSGQ